MIQEVKFPVPSVHSDIKVPGLCSSPGGTMCKREREAVAEVVLLGSDKKL